MIGSMMEGPPDDLNADITKANQDLMIDDINDFIKDMNENEITNIGEPEDIGVDTDVPLSRDAARNELK